MKTERCWGIERANTLAIRELGPLINVIKSKTKLKEEEGMYNTIEKKIQALCPEGCELWPLESSSGVLWVDKDGVDYHKMLHEIPTGILVGFGFVTPSEELLIIPQPIGVLADQSCGWEIWSTEELNMLTRFEALVHADYVVVAKEALMTARESVSSTQEEEQGDDS